MATIENGKGTFALAAFDSKAILQKHEFGRPATGPNDVSIEVKYCGMCHSDLHACNGDWHLNCYPMAPGHEIAGIVKEVGKDVTQKFKVGDRVAVGCMVDACMSCEMCNKGEENYCRNCIQTYGSQYPKGKGHDDCAGFHTNGGYSSEITVRSEFVFAVPDAMKLEYAGPLLCAGITTFSPLNRHVLKKGGNKNVGVVGFGGLGQMAIKLAKAMNSKVTVLSRSTSKKGQAAALGADILAHSDAQALANAKFQFDVIIDTVSAPHEVQPLLQTLKVGGTYVCIGGVPQPMAISAFSLISNNYKMEGSLIGGLPETQEMLDFCNEHQVFPAIKIIHAKDANAQFQALAAGSADVDRAVIDMSTLADVAK